MKKKIVTLLIAGTLALSITACGGSGEDTSSADSTESTEETTEETPAPEEEVTYQTILDDYTKQLQDATPGLVEEYNTEAAAAAGDINKLAEISNSKVEELAVICNNGVSEMAELMTTNGDGYSTYEEWAGKLQDVYTTQSQQITDAYMNSATGQ